MKLYFILCQCSIVFHHLFLAIFKWNCLLFCATVALLLTIYFFVAASIQAASFQAACFQVHIGHRSRNLFPSLAASFQAACFQAHSGRRWRNLFPSLAASFQAACFQASSCGFPSLGGPAWCASSCASRSWRWSSSAPFFKACKSKNNAFLFHLKANLNCVILN